MSELTLEEIKEFSAEKGEKIPTLKEALDFLGNKVKILIELKETGVEKQVLSLVHEKGLQKNVVLVSFIEEALQKVRELDKEVEIGLICAKHKNPVEATSDLETSYLLPLYRFTHPANVQKTHENGLEVKVWTVNKPEEVVEYMKKGVGGIANNKPGILIQ